MSELDHGMNLGRTACNVLAEVANRTASPRLLIYGFLCTLIGFIDGSLGTDATLAMLDELRATTLEFSERRKKRAH